MELDAVEKALATLVDAGPPPYHLAMPCTPGIAESEGPDWEDYAAIESDKSGEVVVEGIHDETAVAVCRLLSAVPELVRIARNVEAEKAEIEAVDWTETLSPRQVWNILDGIQDDAARRLG